MKQFSSFEEQISYLKTDKNLTIDNHAEADTALRQIGYFSLIGGYKGAFKNPNTGQFKDGTQLSDIVALYRLDESLRELVLRYLLRIERHIRSLLSYAFTEKYGSDQSQYLDHSNFNNSPKHRASLDRLIRTLDGLANYNRDYPYINHQRKKHGNVPLWVLVNALSFGSLSKFYFLAAYDVQTKVSVNFAGLNERQLTIILNVLAKYRNVCSHNERLISYQTRNDIPNLVLHSKMKLPTKGKQYTCGKRDFFAVVIALRYLLPNDDFKIFKRSLSSLIKVNLTNSGVIAEADINEMLGLPVNWKTIMRYKR